MFLFRPTFILSQLVVCFALVCMFAHSVNAVPTPQFGFSWRHTLDAKLPMNKAISASASASSTLAEADINPSTLASAPAAATQSSAPYDTGDTGAQAQTNGVTSLARLGAAQMSMGGVAFVLVYFVT